MAEFRQTENQVKERRFMFFTDRELDELNMKLVTVNNYDESTLANLWREIKKEQEFRK